MIDLGVVAKALNSIDLDDLSQALEQVGKLATFMQGEDEEHPLNQAMLRLLTNEHLTETLQRIADDRGVGVENVLYPLATGLLVGLITPVPMDATTGEEP